MCASNNNNNNNAQKNIARNRNAIKCAPVAAVQCINAFYIYGGDRADRMSVEHMLSKAVMLLGVFRCMIGSHTHAHSITTSAIKSRLCNSERATDAFAQLCCLSAKWIFAQ